MCPPISSSIRLAQPHLFTYTLQWYMAPILLFVSQKGREITEKPMARVCQLYSETPYLPGQSRWVYAQCRAVFTIGGPSHGFSSAAPCCGGGWAGQTPTSKIQETSWTINFQEANEAKEGGMLPNSSHSNDQPLVFPRLSDLSHW